jgi:SAM-dependent methyltransferase
MKQPSQFDPRASYDRIARQYADQFLDELSRKPFDRQLLDGWAERVRDRGLVCEIGGGPGQVGHYLHERGVAFCGIDLSFKMAALARTLNPGISFAQGNMLALSLAPRSLAGLFAFYSIIHLRRTDVPRAAREFWRVLKPGGQLLLAFHGGEGENHLDEWFGEPVSVDVTLFQGDEMAGYLASVGFEIESVRERPPYDFEHPTPRLYVSAHKL